jgi:hypothetical protein
MELVARHLPLPQDETHYASFQFLTQRLGIPEHLLHETLVRAPSLGPSQNIRALD